MKYILFAMSCVIFIFSCKEEEFFHFIVDNGEYFINTPLHISGLCEEGIEILKKVKITSDLFDKIVFPSFQDDGD